MGINRNTNPMVVSSSTTITGSIFFSTPCVVKHMIWTSVAGSSSIHLTDMKFNPLFDSVCEPNVPMRIFEDPIVLANGLRFAEAVAGISTSAPMEDGKLFVHIK